MSESNDLNISVYQNTIKLLSQIYCPRNKEKIEKCIKYNINSCIKYKLR